MEETWKSIYVDTFKLLKDIEPEVKRLMGPFANLPSATLVGCYQLFVLVNTYRLHVTIADNLKFPPVLYIRFATVFQIFEHFKFDKTEDGTLVFGLTSL